MKYFKNFGVVFVLFVSMVWAMPTHAAGLNDIQVTAILNLLSSFGADAATIHNVTVALKPSVATDPTTEPHHEGFVCINLKSQMTLGSTDATTGGEVSQLQVFLGDQGTVSAGEPIYPERVVSGYFGPATSRALQKWQKDHGISITTQGVGVVGPKTRAAMRCGEAFQSDTVWSIAPTSGTAPLAVRFTSTLFATHDASEPQHLIDFGDGSANGRITCINSTGTDLGNYRCLQWGVDHVYAASGIYTVKLVRNYNGQTTVLKTSTVIVN